MESEEQMIQLSRDITSLAYFVELKGNRFGHAIHQPSFTAEASMALKLQKEEGTQSDPSGSVRELVCLRTVNQSSVRLRKLFGPLDSMSYRPRIHWGIQAFLMEGEGGGGFKL